MASILKNVFNRLQLLENYISSLLGFRFPPHHFAPALTNGSIHDSYDWNETSLKRLLDEHILWAVPKRRRTIQVRRSRRFGHPHYHWKMLVPNKNIIVCNKCGNHKEAGLLCPTCYGKIREETELMQEAIQAELGLSPVDKEVVVLYDGEKTEENKEFWQGKRIVEMKKTRPLFCKNLLEPSTQAPATATDVKPTDLA